MIELVAFDTETTGVNVETDRIVSAALVILDSRGDVAQTSAWLINPGVPIPAGATNVHGITDEMVAARGMDAAQGIESVATALAAFTATRPLVVFNAAFDLTLLDREIRRHEVSPFVGDITDGDGWGMWWDPAPVVDPFIIDKALDRYRRGKRTLTALAEHMAIPFEGQAHGAVADATTAGRIAQRMLSNSHLSGYNLGALHEAQVRWADEQATRFADYLRSQGTDPSDVSGEWPTRSAPS